MIRLIMFLLILMATGCQINPDGDIVTGETFTVYITNTTFHDLKIFNSDDEILDTLHRFDEDEVFTFSTEWISIGQVVPSELYLIEDGGHYITIDKKNLQREYK